MKIYIVYKINDDLSMCPDATFEGIPLVEVDNYLLTIPYKSYQVELTTEFISTVIYSVIYQN
jgi:hypothetical protein